MLRVFSLILLLCCFSCSSTKTTLKPQLDYSIQDKYLQNLKPIFPPLTEEELSNSWAVEYQLGLCFAKKLDLFHAVTSFKRADILIPQNLFQRKSEIQYHIINSYYLGKKYYDVIDTFEDSILASTTRNFEGFHDLLIILFESYLKCDQKDRADWILHTMKKFFPTNAQKLELSSHLYQANLFELTKITSESPNNQTFNALATKNSEQDSEISLVNNDEIDPFSDTEEQDRKNLDEYTRCKTAVKEILTTYQQYKKSPLLAQTLNAVLPGAGYLYLGQKQSAFTAFSINSLFIATAGYFYYQGNIPASIITIGFESGWYLGGIIGAGDSAKLYNERLFETHAHPHMRDNRLFPILMLNYGF